MTKVALIVHAFPSLEHPYILDWAKGLAASGIDLIIYAEQAGEGGAASRSGPEAGFWSRVKYLNSLGDPANSLRRNFSASLKNIFQIPRAWKILSQSHPGRFLSVLRKLYEYLPLLGERFDVLHLNAPQIAVRRFELGELLAAKTLVSFRGQDFSFHRERYDALLRDADHLHFISNHLVELAKERGYAGHKHTLIPPMVDLEFYHPTMRKAATDATVLFSAARFSWTKGWEFALQAVAILLKRGWNIQYVVAGDGEMKDAILYTIHELNLDDRVQLCGWLSPEDLKLKMQAADLYLLASVEEAFNNSILQAQACGLPVVCSDAGGLPENIVDGETGLLFKRRDAWDMADKIEALLSNPELCAQMSRSARERVEKNFSTQAGVQKFVSLYCLLTG
jgi:colanic acid/amylovoran biosynthesis glycosyltransferase